MKKTFSIFLTTVIILLGAIYFIQKNSTLPTDFNTLIMLWQNNQAQELHDIFGLWAEAPIGTGERTLKYDISYIGLNFSGKISGPISSDIAGKKSLWSTTIEMNGKNSTNSLPLPSNILFKGPMQIGQDSFIYITPGDVSVSLPSQSSTLQNQLQDALGLSRDKTFKISDKNLSFLQLSNWIKFYTELTKNPVFLLNRSEGEIEGRYEYSISLLPTYTDLFIQILEPLNNCRISIAKKNIDDFILDCRSSETRVVWSSHSDKMIIDDKYAITYKISHTLGEKPKWKSEIYEGNLKKAEIEGHAERINNQITWEIKTDNIPSGFEGTISGQESRNQINNLDLASPDSYSSWEDISKELVY